MLSNRGNIKIHRKGQNRCLETHMFTGRAVPVAVGNDHQRRTKTGCVEGSVTFITEQQLQHTTKEINIIQSKGTIFNVLNSNVEYFSIVRQDFKNYFHELFSQGKNIKTVLSHKWNKFLIQQRTLNILWFYNMFLSKLKCFIFKSC